MRRAFDARREALRDAELCETTKLRVEHAAQVERLQRRVVAAALCASGGEQVRGTHSLFPLGTFRRVPTTPTFPTRPRYPPRCTLSGTSRSSR